MRFFSLRKLRKPGTLSYFDLLLSIVKQSPAEAGLVSLCNMHLFVISLRKLSGSVHKTDDELWHQLRS